jgi:hypothetical protein
MRTFSRNGITLKYPTNWTLDPQEDGEGWSITLSSPQTAFLIVSLHSDATNVSTLAHEALTALQAEYPDVESEHLVDTLALAPAIGYDFDFLTVDTTVVGWIRAIDTNSGPLLVFCQVSEYDRSQNEQVLRAICASLHIEPIGTEDEPV